MFQPNRLVFFGLCLSAFVGLAACQKENAVPEASTVALLVGRWELTQTAGGLTGHVLPADPNRKQEVIFTADGQAENIVNGIIVSTGPYTLTQAISRLNHRPQTFLACGPAGQENRQYIEQILPTNLVLVQDYEDGIGSSFTRR